MVRMRLFALSTSRKIELEFIEFLKESIEDYQMFNDIFPFTDAEYAIVADSEAKQKLLNHPFVFSVFLAFKFIKPRQGYSFWRISNTMNHVEVTQTLHEFLDKYDELKDLSEQQLLQKGDYQAYEPKKKPQVDREKIKKEKRAKAKKNLEDLSEEELHQLMIGDDDELLELDIGMREMNIGSSPKAKRLTRAGKGKTNKDAAETSSVAGDDDNLALLKELEMQQEFDQEDREFEEQKKQKLARLNKIVG